MNKAASIFGGIAGAVRAAQLRRELSRMSDYQLADIGLSRDAITGRVLGL